MNKVIKYFIVSFIAIILFTCLSCDSNKTYTINFDSDGGTAVESITVKKGELATRPADPYKEDWCFAGWYYKDKVFSFAKTTIKKDYDLVGKWIIPFLYTENENSVSLDRFIEFSTRTEIVTPKFVNGKPVTKISDGCFAPDQSGGEKKESYLKKITISEGVETIGDYAFFGCGAVEKIILPESVTSLGSGFCANCPKLTIVNIPTKITEIPNDAFAWCESLSGIEIRDGIKSIGSSAFMDCKNITTINLPDSVDYLGVEAFFNCQRLSNIRLSNNLTSIPKSCFEGCTTLIGVVIPNKVTFIADAAFFDCPSLLSCYIPASVSVIGKNVFKDSPNCVISCEANLDEVNWILNWNCNCKVYWGVK